MKNNAVAAEKRPVEEILVESETQLGEHAVKVFNGRRVGESAAENIGLSVIYTRIICAGIAAFFGKVILPTLLGITQDAVGFIDLFELLFSLLFIARVFIGVVFESEFAESVLYIIKTGIFINAKNPVIVFHSTNYSMQADLKAGGVAVNV